LLKLEIFIKLVCLKIYSLLLLLLFLLICYEQ
jgi:hypothetical protein